MEQILSRLLVSRFYKMNAGFFLFLFIMLFGLLPGADSIRLHHAIMEAVTGTLPYALVAIAVFTIYNFKCISFSLKEINLPENIFLFNIQGTNNRKQFFALLGCHASIYFPILFYGTITACVGFSGGHYMLGGIILTWQILMCISGAFIYFYKFNSTWLTPVFTLPSFPFSRKKSESFYLMYYSVFNRKGTFIAIKIFSLLLLQFLVALNADKASKENVCFLSLFCISAHALLPVHYVRFTEQELSLLRNLPLTLAKRLSFFVITYVIIFIPEMLFLLWNERNILPIPMILSLYALSISRLTLYTSLQYFNKMSIDRYTSVVLVLFFVTLILLASINLWVFAIAEGIVSVALFARLYPRFEGLVKVVE